MGAITDVVNLVLELEKRVTDRKILDLLLPIKQKIHDAEKENFELEKVQFRQEKKFHEEKERLLKTHAEEISKLISEVDSLKSQLEAKSKSGICSVPLTRA